MKDASRNTLAKGNLDHIHRSVGSFNLETLKTWQRIFKTQYVMFCELNKKNDLTDVNILKETS